MNVINSKETFLLAGDTPHRSHAPAWERKPGTLQRPFVLAGDVGGTKTNLGLYQAGKKRPVLKVLETYASREFKGLGQVIEQFRKANDFPIAAACFGVAGPVRRGRCKATNLPWDISEADIQRRFNWRHARLVNDLAATAMAIPLLVRRELAELNAVRLRAGETVGLVAPGTGLGIGLLVHCCVRYVPVASEGGHVDFAPNDERQDRLWAYLNRRFGHVSVERLVSGPGLFNIYCWLRDGEGYKEPLWLKRKLKEADAPKVIAETAMTGQSRLCREALNMFVSILGAVAGNLALTGMTTGGLYLGGGIAPKILPVLREATFMEAFLSKGRFRRVLEEIPVRVILNDKAALLGAASCAMVME